MSYQPRVPFRRAFDAARLADFPEAPQTICAAPVDKWDALRALGAARKRFGLSDRTLSVLQALLSFHAESQLSVGGPAPIVYPANATICARLNGMPCSTMRRHIAALVKAGFLIRRDSPNGKRFKRVSAASTQAFGFDLSPLVTRFEELSQIADELRAEQAHLDQQRTNISLMRRDLAALSELARRERPDLDIWDAYSDLAALIARDLRRKLDGDALEQLSAHCAAALADLQRHISRHFPGEVSSSPAQIEQQHQSSDKEIDKKNLEPSRGAETLSKDVRPKMTPSVSLQMVRSACLEIGSYYSEPLRDWSDLIRVADRLRPMMGIAPAVWQRAVEAMGLSQAAVVLAAMLERFSEIKSPSGYLQHLARKAEDGVFSCTGMILALARRQDV